VATSDVRACAEEVEAIGATLHDIPLQVAGWYYRIWLGTLSGDYRETERLCRTLTDALPVICRGLSAAQISHDLVGDFQ